MTETTERSISCIGLPLPKSIQNIFPRLQIPHPSAANEHAANVIREFGNRYRRAEQEIARAIDLASGFDDVVIILERPAYHHNYATTFDVFVSESPTLKCVDDILRLVSRGRRSIKDTSVIDAFMFSPLNSTEAPPQDECHNLAQKLLEIRRPDGILACCNNITKDHSLNKFSGCDVASAPAVTSESMGSKRVKVVQCFHPGYCTNRVTLDPKARLVLLLAFVLVFTRQSTDHKNIMVIAKHVRTIKYNEDNSVDKIQATRRLWEMVRQIHDVSKIAPFCEMTDELGNVSVANRTRDQLFDQLWTLDWVQKTDVPFQVMTALLLWNKFWAHHFLRKEILDNMIRLWSRQRMPWEQSANLDEDLSRLSISLPKQTPATNGQSRWFATKHAEDHTREDEILTNWNDAISLHIMELRSLIVSLSNLRRQMAHRHQVRKDGGQDDNIDNDNNDGESAEGNASSALAFHAHFTIERALCLLSTNVVLIVGQQGCFPEEPAPNRSLLDREDARDIVEKTLEQTMYLKELMDVALESMTKIESADPLFVVGHDEQERPSRLIQRGGLYKDVIDSRCHLIALRLQLAGHYMLDERIGYAKQGDVQELVKEDNGSLKQLYQDMLKHAQR